MKCLASLYIGLPKIFRMDRETSFPYMEFREDADNVDIELEFGGGTHLHRTGRIISPPTEEDIQ